MLRRTRYLRRRTGQLGGVLARSARCVAPVLLLAFLLPLRATGSGAPTGEEVIEKAISAMGGAEAMRALENRWMQGRMEIAAMGLSARLESYAARPSRTRTSIRSEAFGAIEEGGDGEVFWEQSAMAGPKLKKGPALSRARREADFEGMMNWKAWYRSAEAQGADTLEGKPAWKVLMTPNEGNPDTLWFDQESGLPVRQATIMPTDQGEIPVEVSLLDYREAGGVKVPFHIRQSVLKGMQVIDILTDSLRVNIDLPAGAFDPPTEVKALIEKEKAAEAAPVPAEKK